MHKDINLKFDRHISSTYPDIKKQLAALYLKKNKCIEAIYNLTEYHGADLRQDCLNKIVENSSGNDDYFNNSLSFFSQYSKDGSEGMLRRLREMPKEWTVVQLTILDDYSDTHLIKSTNNAQSGGELKPRRMKTFNITRLVCGRNFESDTPLIVEIEWSNERKDLLKRFNKIQVKLAENNEEMTDKVEKFVTKSCKNITDSILKEWLVMFLGTLCDEEMSKFIRAQIDEVLFHQFDITVSSSQRYMTYVIAEGIIDIEFNYLDRALNEVFPKNRHVQTELRKKMEALKLSLDRDNFVKRNSVILIVDNCLYQIPWENLVPFNRHPYSRMASIHFLHAVYGVHSKRIKYGLRMIHIDAEQFYCILNDKLANLINKIIDIDNCRGLSESRRKYMPLYLETGDISNKTTDKSTIKSSTHVGKIAEEKNGDQFSHTVKYLLAGGLAELDMLWTGNPNDCDELLTNIARIWQSDVSYKKVNNTTSKRKTSEKEPELLRAIVDGRELSEQSFVRAALIVKGVPIIAC